MSPETYLLLEKTGLFIFKGNLFSCGKIAKERLTNFIFVIMSGEKLKPLTSQAKVHPRN